MLVLVGEVKCIKYVDFFVELKGRWISGVNLIYCLVRNLSCFENDYF